MLVVAGKAGIAGKGARRRCALVEAEVGPSVLEPRSILDRHLAADEPSLEPAVPLDRHLALRTPDFQDQHRLLRKCPRAGELLEGLPVEIRVMEEARIGFLRRP